MYVGSLLLYLLVSNESCYKIQKYRARFLKILLLKLLQNRISNKRSLENSVIDSF